jgi:nicotinamide-nucleotide amidase
MPSAELIAIGTELLLGEIQDTNSRFLARQLRDFGIDLFRTTNIGDNAARIASAIQESLSRADIVITTGGLGPTVDDPTREAAALAFETTCEFHPELWTGIEERFLRRGITPTENNKRQAYLPTGSTLVPNPVGTAPAFYIEKDGKFLFCLPGVPKEMEFITRESVLPLLKEIFHLHSVIKVRVIHLAGVGESAVDQPIADLERLSNPTVGLLAHPGIVDIRITAKADDVPAAEKLIAGIESRILALFPEDIFGFNEQTLSQSVNTLCKNMGFKIMIRESGLSDQWPVEFIVDDRLTLESTPNRIDLETIAQQPQGKTEVLIFCNYYESGRDCHLDYALSLQGKFTRDSAIYSGPQAQGKTWAANRVMDILRRALSQLTK